MQELNEKFSIAYCKLDPFGAESRGKLILPGKTSQKINFIENIKKQILFWE